MKRGRITMIILFSVLGLLLLFLFIYIGSIKRYQWYESLNTDSDQPYGTLFVRKLLEEYHTDGEFTMNRKQSVHDLLDSTGSLKNTSYVFIGQALFLSDNDLEALLGFMDSGNDVFVSTVGLPEQLMNRVYVNECDQYLTLQSGEPGNATMNFYHAGLKTPRGYTYKYRVGSDDLPYFWNAINREVFCDSTKSLTPLGYKKPAEVNFMKFKYGKGNLYFHTNPIVFTNYFILQSDKANYAAGVFSHLGGKDIIWDEFSKTPFAFDNPDAYNSPLYYILQQPSLKYAWWMLLFTVVLYAYFAARRTQRVIPVLEAKTNTSLEFIQLISSLHFQNANHFDIAKKKMKYFQYFIKARYGIQTQVVSEDQIIRLAEKSKVNRNDVQTIFSLYKQIETSSYYNIEADRLSDLYYAIDHFYKHCK